MAIEAPARQGTNARSGWECKNAPVIGALDRRSNLMLENSAMCEGEGLGLIQMAMTPIGLAVTAGVAAALFLFARRLIAD